MFLKEGKFSKSTPDVTEAVNNLFKELEQRSDSFWKAQNYVEARSYRLIDIKYKQFPMLKAQIILELYQRGSNLGQCRLINEKHRDIENDPKAIQKLNVFRNYRRRMMDMRLKEIEKSINNEKLLSKNN